MSMKKQKVRDYTTSLYEIIANSSAEKIIAFSKDEFKTKAQVPNTEEKSVPKDFF
jgi:hypothetical protein